MDIGHNTWTLAMLHGQFFQKIFFLNFYGQCTWTICTQPVIPNNPKIKDIIDRNLLEVQKTPKKAVENLINATNIVQTISNPAFCILSNIIFKLFLIN
jgi:hypothetical protein